MDTIHKDKIYIGRRRPNGCQVQVVFYSADVRIKKMLRARLDLANHSPTGFEWGYAGSGPAQLALAILADLLGDDPSALRLHQTFKANLVALLPRDTGFELSGDDLQRVIFILREDAARPGLSPITHKGGEIVDGHMRARAAQELGVPVGVQPDEDAAKLVSDAAEAVEIFGDAELDGGV